MKLTTTFEPQHKRASRPVRTRPTRETLKLEVSSAARNLALAHYIDRLIERGVIADYTQAARMLAVSPARMSHIMGLLLLSPAIQESILSGVTPRKDKELREMARITEWDVQASSTPR